LRSRVPPTIKTDASYTLLLFAHNTGDVVRSPVVRKALEEFTPEPGVRVIAAGANFTEEARRDLAERGVLIISFGDFYWTDKSIDEIRHL
jgi:hypothetical protein